MSVSNCCQNDCLEMILPACIAPVEGMQCVAGNNLQEQIIALSIIACTTLENTVTVSFGQVDCDPYKFEYTLTDLTPLNTTSNFTMTIDLFAFNEPVTNMFNMIVSNVTTGAIIYNGANTSISMPKPTLLQGINITIQFITNTGQIKTYTDTIVLNSFSVLNQSYVKYMNCNANGLITTSVQAVLQTIINQLQSCC